LGVPLGAHPVNRRLQDVAVHSVQHVPRRDARRRIRAHAARVGARVVVADALVVLCGREGSDGVPIAEGEDAELVAGEEFLDDNFIACGTEFAVEHDVL
jgi:hypothetical protein